MENAISNPKTPDVVSSKLREYVNSLDNFMEDVNNLIEENGGVDGFVQTNLKKMMGLFSSVINLLKSLDITSIDELQELLKVTAIGAQQDEELADAIEDYFQSDQKWDTFLEKLDKQLNNSLTPNKGELIQLESLESPGKFETFNDIVAPEGFKFTWVVFLRHFA
jgi:type II secretory pathway component PulK